MVCVNNDILSRLYYGKITPWEKQQDKTFERDAVRERIDNLFDGLSKQLSDEGKVQLNKLMDDNTYLHTFMIFDSFKDGYRLGAELMLAALKHDN